ncbi:MAG: CDP-alcohol phosphatidyltransferase family protein [Promethearchaeota archaeon]
MLLHIKKFSEKLLTPLGKKLTKIPANYFTILGLFSSILTFFGFLFQIILIIIIFLFITEFFDQLDGVVARLQGPTKFGAFLDSTLDRIGDFFIFTGVFFGGYTLIEISLIVLFGAFLTSYTRAKIETFNVNDLYGVGLLERTDRIPILLIGTIFQIWFHKAIFWTMIILAIGTVFTVIQRIIYAYKKFSKEKKEEII